MTYVIAEKPGEENSIVKVEDRSRAETLVKNITDQIGVVLNREHLTITRKEDDVIVKWNGELMVKICIREDDEVDVTPTNK